MRAFELVEELGCGEVLNTIIDRDYGENKERSVPFDADWINGFLGTDIPESDMIKYLNSLDFEIRDGKAIAPYDRIDIECKADIAEEVARIYGYNNIPSTIITGIANAKRTPMQKLKANIKSAMIAQGFYEIQTYSFVSPKGLDKINLPEDSALRNPVVISNPLGEDTSVMRTSALPSLCEVMARNQNYRNMSGSIFEIATEYIKTDDVLPNELSRLVIGMYDAENGVDFFDLKGVVEEVLERIGISDYEVLRASESKCFDEKAAFHPGRSAVIIKDGTELAILGELHPDVLENYDMSVRCYAAKLNVDEALELAKDEKVYKPLPKFPAATRDISFVCDEAIPVAELEKAIKKAVGKILEEVHLFDVYQGEQIEKGKKSVSYSITMRSHNETLTDEQADNAMKKVLKALVAMGAQLRG
ncbi:MAG: phenylalanine--tRNA ligase subunit beta, partial [Ruminococcus sp.]|nr:phenylalanine--tRNA ligase subunit beta [Ruminococcus sp.]